MKNETLTSISGIRVGHYTDLRNLTGCTVIRFPKEGATAGVDVRGSAPGTRETDLLSPINLIDRIHALVLSGGSAFGLDTAGGVMTCLEEEGIGYETRKGIRVPLVPAAILYDLGVGNPKVRPDAKAGYIACQEASDQPVAQGNVGAGTGATVGKVLGGQGVMKGGLGSTAVLLPDGVIVAALVAVNAVGDVVDPQTSEIIAGVRSDQKGMFLDAMRLLREKPSLTLFPGENTTIGLVATNAPFLKTELTKIAQMAHDGLARAVRPAHTSYDGDTIFAVSVRDPAINTKPNVTTIGSLGAEVLTQAVVQAVKQAKTVGELVAWSDWVG